MANCLALLTLCSLAVLATAAADGYPKEGPVAQDSPATPPAATTSPAEQMSAQPSGAASPAGTPAPSQPTITPPYSSLYPGMAPWLYAGQYPAVSTDYVSRYYGPIAVPVVLPDGTIADTPAVAAARTAHLTALNQAKALWFGKVDDGSYDPFKYGDYAAQYYPGSVFNRQYLAALAQGSPNALAGPLPVSKQYLPALSTQAALNPHYLHALAAQSPLNNQYLATLAAQAPLNNPYLGTLAAQAPFNNQYLATLAAQAPLNKQYLDSLAAQAPLNKQYLDALAAQGGLNKPYFGPLANPLVLPSGYLADTPEVAALRAAHLSTLQRAQADAALWRSHYKKSWNK